MRTTAPGQSALLLLDVIHILNERNILYAIIGAFAASFYGMVRASLDADAVISIHTSQDAVHLCDDLRLQGFSIDYRRGDREDPISALINIQDYFHNRVDLLIGIRGTTPEIFQRVQEAQFKDSSIKIVGQEDFIALKMFAGSLQDIHDVIGVLKVSGPKIDFSLLKKLTARYGTNCLQKLQALLKEYHF